MLVLLTVPLSEIKSYVVVLSFYIKMMKQRTLQACNSRHSTKKGIAPNKNLAFAGIFHKLTMSCKAKHGSLITKTKLFQFKNHVMSHYVICVLKVKLVCLSQS